MKEIVKVLLQEGIDESMINKVLNLIEEEYEVVDEKVTDEIKNIKVYSDRSNTFDYRGNKYHYTPKKATGHIWDDTYEVKPSELKKVGPADKYENKSELEKVRDDKNAEFDKARSKYLALERGAKNQARKLNKEVAKIEAEHGKNSFPRVETKDSKDYVKNIDSLKDKALKASSDFDKVNSKQIKDGELIKGLKYEKSDIHHTKKGDNFGFHPVVKKS